MNKDKGRYWDKPFNIPLKRKKPTVYAVWNDLFHEAVPWTFQNEAYGVMLEPSYHTYLVLTKRPRKMLEVMPGFTMEFPPNIYHGLTICNQEEADEKIPIFLQVPGKKFLSIEPMLSEINIREALEDGYPTQEQIDSNRGMHYLRHGSPRIDAVILGGETGPGARPMHPDWVRSVRDQCSAAGVPFFFKGWGKHVPCLQILFGSHFERVRRNMPDRYEIVNRGRLLDGRTHDDLPWR